MRITMIYLPPTRERASDDSLLRAIFIFLMQREAVLNQRLLLQWLIQGWDTQHCRTGTCNVSEIYLLMNITEDCWHYYDGVNGTAECQLQTFLYAMILSFYRPLWEDVFAETIPITKRSMYRLWTYINLETHINLRFKVQGFLAAMAVMPRELKVKTLEGGDLTVEVIPASTIKELKAILREKKHCEDPIEDQILKVKVLADGLLVDDDQTLESAGLLHAESEVTAIYCRNEVEAAKKEAIHPEGLLQVNIPCSLTEISAGAFGNCNQMVKVAIPESVTAIREYAFASCNSLASATIPPSVTKIGNGAFLKCTSLASITLAESVTVIGDCAFEDCVSLASIAIPTSVRTIARSTFVGCTSMTVVIIPNSVEVILDYAFAYCSSLASVTIPESVTAIGDYAFAHCSSLASITIPESVTAIGRSAFADCKSLASITIPDSVTTIADSAFRDCESLASIKIPDSVAVIGSGAFRGCSSLTRITVPDCLTGDNAFDEKLEVERRPVWLCWQHCNCWKCRCSMFFEGLIWLPFGRLARSKWIGKCWFELNLTPEEAVFFER